ncbi:MAG: glutamine synthetase family protein [Pseudomonadota bacterium]
MKTWLQENPDVRSIRIACPDLNGQPRGKRLPAKYADKAIAGEMRFPLSVLNLDIWGEDIKNSPLVLKSGDQDGVLKPTERGFVPIPWLETPQALLPVSMFHEDGRPYQGDPRHALRAVIERYIARGLTPVCALELEFFLIDDTGPLPQVPASPRSGKRRIAGDILGMRALDQFDQFLTELYDACDKMGIPADAAISESGLGQFEINLLHEPDALRVADNAWLFKMLVKGLARRHGFAATFMAKPYGDYSGSGLHLHFSVLGENGQNIFDNDRSDGSDALRHAVAGCLDCLQSSALIFAPHANSFERLVPGSHAPAGICWGYENRTTALRIPSSASSARRIEHRVAGGDVNPYLLLAAVLGAALNGMEDCTAPPEPLVGNAYHAETPQLTNEWATALHLFETDPQVARIFSPTLIRNFTMTKHQEMRQMALLAHAEQIDIYLSSL